MFKENNLEEKIKKMEETILQKEMPKEEKGKLLGQFEELKKVLKDKKIVRKFPRASS